MRTRPGPPLFAVLALLLLGGSAAAQTAPFVFHPQERRFSFGLVTGARLALEVNGKTLWAEQAAHLAWSGPASGEISSGPARAEFQFENPAITWTVEFRRAAGGAATIASTIRNTGSAAVRLGRCRLADTSEGNLVLGPQVDKTVLLALSGWQGPSRVVALHDGKPHVSKVLAQLYNPASHTALQFSFVTFDRANTEHQVAWNPERSTPVVSSSCDFEGYSLAAGAAIASETLRIENGSDAFAGLRHWADLVQEHYHPAIPPQTPAGWVGWSWVDPFHSERYEDVVRRNAQAIRDRLPGLDIDYLWVSLGNLEGRMPGNWLRWNRELFPSSPETLVRDLGRLNFRLGLWAGAFWLSSRLTAEVERLRDALLLRDGRPITVPNKQWGDVYVLDPTHPKTQSFLRGVFTQYRQWGVRYFMIDFLDSIGGSTPGTYRPDAYYDRSLVPGPQAYRAGLRTIRDAAGPETYLLASTGPTLLDVGLVDAVRAGNDYGEGRPLDGPGKGFFPATFVINRPDYWTSHRAATNALAASFFTHRKLYLADSGNVLTIDKPVALPDAQISATIFGINGGPLMLGDDIARMDDGRLAMVKQLFPRLPECAVPLDLFETPDPDYPKMFHLKISRPWGQWDLLALFNYGPEMLHQSIALERLDLDPRQTYAVWDFWNERYAGTQSATLQVDVPARSVRLLRISRIEDHPWVVSTDMHIRQGQAEIESVRWDAHRQELTIQASRPSGYRGNVYVRVPLGLALKEPAGLWIAKDAGEGTLIVRCPFEFPKEGKASKTLAFVPYPR